MSLAVSPPLRRRSRRGHTRSRAWLQWQQSTVSQRVLTENARQEGYAALRVPPPLQPSFLDVARAFRLYETLFHKPQRALSSKQLASLRAWADATAALITVLQEAVDD